MPLSDRVFAIEKESDTISKTYDCFGIMGSQQ